MTARTHDAAAFSLLSVAFLIVEPSAISLSTVIVSILANLTGGIAPDIDQPTAPFWRNLPIGKYFGRIFGTVSGGHRFITHSIVGVGLATFLFHSLMLLLHPIMTSVDTGYVTWAFLLGIISHLIMDSFTKEGVPWLLPLPIKFGFPPIKAWRITTGKWIEAGFIFPLLLALNGWIYFTHYEQFVYIIQHSITK